MRVWLRVVVKGKILVMGKVGMSKESCVEGRVGVVGP